MNERIRELQEQAFSECKTFENDSMVRTDEVFEKFAELVVLDICTVLETAHLDERLNTSWDEPYLQLMKCIGSGFSTYCKEHFGVVK